MMEQDTFGVMTLSRLGVALAILAATSCRQPDNQSYLFVWAGDSANSASDFLGVIDATPGSASYGALVASLPVGAAGTHPHHTEAVMAAGGRLLANGFAAGTTWLFDLSQPTQPKIVTSFGDKAGFTRPHSYVRLADGNVLATFQYAAGDTRAGSHSHGHGAAAGAAPAHGTGGLVQMDEHGTVIRSASARDSAITDRLLYPYSVLPLPAIDRAVSTTTDMDDNDTAATGRWIQLWRLSDLTLLRSIALEPGPRGTEHRWTGEPFLLGDGSVYVHTFMCGLYRVTGLDGAAPAATLVHTFEGKFCGVPVLTGQWYLATVPQAHALVALDVSDPAHPREVSRVTFSDAEEPHWISLDPSGTRVVLNSGADGRRLYLIDFDRASGRLVLDERFRDAGDSLPGVKMSGRSWPHGFTGTARPHGTVFSR